MIEQHLQSKRISSSSGYKTYAHRSKKDKLYIPRELYPRIIHRINQLIFEQILLPGDAYEIPRVGKHQIIKRKTKKNPINRQLSSKRKKLFIAYTNFHTDGYTCRNIFRPKVQKFWKFKALRTNKRKNHSKQEDKMTMVEYIKQHGIDQYFEPNEHRNIRTVKIGLS